MARDAFLAARLLLVFLGVSLGLAFVLVLVGSSDQAGFSDIVKGAVLAVGAGFGGTISERVGGATLSATATPLLIAFVPAIVAWLLLRRASLRIEWVGAVATCAGLGTWGMVAWANGWDRLTVNAPVAGGGVAAAIVVVGALARSSRRWPVMGRPLDLVALAAAGLVLLGLVTELACGLSAGGHGSGHVPVHTQIPLAIAYAPNVGVAALALGLGGGLSVTGISSEYFAFVGRFVGDGPVARFGAPHGEGPWADALHLPGLVSVFLLAPLLVLTVAGTTRWLRTRGELIAWAVALGALVVGSALAAAAAVSVDYEGFVLGGSLDPTWWGRLAGLSAIPLGLAVFALTRSAGQPRLDVGDSTRELSREVS
jgi:hypothetical protein